MAMIPYAATDSCIAKLVFLASVPGRDRLRYVCVVCGSSSTLVCAQYYILPISHPLHIVLVDRIHSLNTRVVKFDVDYCHGGSLVTRGQPKR